MQTEMKTTLLPDCLWQQAGVVRYKPCTTDFSCSTCRFDQAMNRVCRINQSRQAQQVFPKPKWSGFTFWTERLKQLPPAQRPCIHHMKGQIRFKSCPKSYQCIDCEFDQYFDDQLKVNAVLKPVAFEDVNGICLPHGFYLHTGHAWMKIEENRMVRVGVDDFAGRLLGRCDSLDVPLMGEPVRQGVPAVSLHRDGHRAAVVSPVSGVVTEVNARVRHTPDLICRSPYTDGWLFMAYCPDLKADLKQLLFMDSARQFLEHTMDRLHEFLAEKTQLKAADGGSLVKDIFGSLQTVQWETLVNAFIAPDS